MIKKMVLVCMAIVAVCFFCESSHAATIKAMARDANLWLIGKKVDHVYVCVGSSCYALPGGTTGGKELAGSRGTGTGKKAKCVAKSSKCKIVWGVNGTCQQGANRMLYEIKKTCSKARGYSVTCAMFGKYGSTSSWLLCRLSCSL